MKLYEPGILQIQFKKNCSPKTLEISSTVHWTHPHQARVQWQLKNTREGNSHRLQNFPLVCVLFTYRQKPKTWLSQTINWKKWKHQGTRTRPCPESRKPVNLKKFSEDLSWPSSGPWLSASNDWQADLYQRFLGDKEAWQTMKLFFVKLGEIR